MSKSPAALPHLPQAHAQYTQSLNLLKTSTFPTPKESVSLSTAESALSLNHKALQNSVRQNIRMKTDHSRNGMHFAPTEAPRESITSLRPISCASPMQQMAINKSSEEFSKVWTKSLSGKKKSQMMNNFIKNLQNQLIQSPKKVYQSPLNQGRNISNTKEQKGKETAQVLKRFTFNMTPQDIIQPAYRVGTDVSEMQNDNDGSPSKQIKLPRLSCDQGITAQQETPDWQRLKASPLTTLHSQSKINCLPVFLPLSPQAKGGKTSRNAKGVSSTLQQAFTSYTQQSITDKPAAMPDSESPRKRIGNLVRKPRSGSQMQQKQNVCQTPKEGALFVYKNGQFIQVQQSSEESSDVKKVSIEEQLSKAINQETEGKASSKPKNDQPIQHQSVENRGTASGEYNTKRQMSDELVFSFAQSSSEQQISQQEKSKSNKGSFLQFHPITAIETSEEQLDQQSSEQVIAMNFPKPSALFQKLSSNESSVRPNKKIESKEFQSEQSKFSDTKSATISQKLKNIRFSRLVSFDVSSKASSSQYANADISDVLNKKFNRRQVCKSKDKKPTSSQFVSGEKSSAVKSSQKFTLGYQGVLQHRHLNSQSNKTVSKKVTDSSFCATSHEEPKLDGRKKEVEYRISTETFEGSFSCSDSGSECSTMSDSQADQETVEEFIRRMNFARNSIKIQPLQDSQEERVQTPKRAKDACKNKKRKLINKFKESVISDENGLPYFDLKQTSQMALIHDLLGSKSDSLRCNSQQPRKESKVSEHGDLKNIRQRVIQVRTGTPSKRSQCRQQYKQIKLNIQMQTKINDELITSQPRLEEPLDPLLDATIHEEDVEESIAKCRETEMEEKRRQLLVIPRSAVMLIQNQGEELAGKGPEAQTLVTVRKGPNVIDQGQGKKPQVAKKRIVIQQL